MNMENWLPVYGWEDLYEVSDLGKVRDVRNGRILSDNPGNNGYPRVSLRRDGRTTQYLVHRLVLLSHVGPCPAGHESLHHDGNRTNARLDNLRWGSHLENMNDQRRHGRTGAGVRRKYVCKNGHDILADSYTRPDGHVVCRECMRNNTRRWRAAKAADRSRR